mgnify:CR=1 FL=1
MVEEQSEDSSEEVVTLKVRMTPEFRKQIIQSAKDNKRSMNTEIVHRLEQSYESDDAQRKVPETLETILEEIRALKKTDV